jgi:hypothetical protein
MTGADAQPAPVSRLAILDGPSAQLPAALVSTEAKRHR